MKLLFGSYNKHKADEVRAIFAGLGMDSYEIVIPPDLSDEVRDVEETGTTLACNAEIKARAFFERFGVPCFADDTGLEVQELDGRPGVLSARYAGEHGNDALNRHKLLAELGNLPADRRGARFRTVICFFDGDETLFAEGECTGRIVSEEKGKNGFGYDSIFLPDGYNRTMAELPAEEKNKLSHRARAVECFAKKLKSAVKSTKINGRE